MQTLATFCFLSITAAIWINLLYFSHQIRLQQKAVACVIYFSKKAEEYNLGAAELTYP